MPILPNEKKALEELRERLLNLYRVRDMQVFGSKARGTDVEGSDVDVMIVLEESTPAIESEIDDLVFEINLKHGCLIVPLYFGQDELESGPLSEAPVYKRILSEGIRL
jgi:predicted nucleotidyltransferase